MPIIIAKLRFFRDYLARPAILVWLLAGLGMAAVLCAAWGLLHVTSLSARAETRDDRAATIAMNLKEEVAAYSKLTYDFLLQQDYSKMLVKEKQSNSIRTAIEQNLIDLGTIDQNQNATAHNAIESIRTTTTQFLVLTDKALETAAEEGSAQKARAYLQDEVEPAYKNAEDFINQLISSRDQFDASRFQHARSQALTVIAMLIGLTALGVALLLALRTHIIGGMPHRRRDDLIEPELQTLAQQSIESALDVEGRSLATLAFANRLSRVRKESDDLRKLLQGLHVFVNASPETAPVVQPPQAGDAEVDTLSRQSEKIAHAVGRIQHIHDQSKVFIEKLGEMMNAVQKLATDGNVVALNVTIELAKLQTQNGGTVQEEKNKSVSEQIRGLATSAASITGKLAMVLSQFRYTQEDFSRHTTELMDIRSHSGDALERVRGALQTNGQSAARLTERRDEFTTYLPSLERKMAELESQISQLQSIYSSDIETPSEGVTPRSFKVISGGAG